MSTGYRPLKDVAARDLFDGRLVEFGVREHVLKHKSDKERVLTDGRNYLAVSIDDNGLVGCITRRGLHAPDKILDAVAQAFDTDIVSEYEPQFWGFSTQKEWDAWHEAEAKKSDEKFYVEFLKFLRGEPNDIRPGSVGMREAEIAKTLVEKDPTLLLLENKDRLLHEMWSTYLRDHAVRVTLSPEDVAFAHMVATHEDDLPSA
jgi:hypothetical protein